MSKNEVPILGITRHRINIDGPGIITLVAFCGCPLNCKYCLNNECHDTIENNLVTVEELYDIVKIDNMYFLYSGGGITFGGGEPLLYNDFIRDFKRLCHPKWKINIETSLNVYTSKLTTLIDIIDTWIIDIKDLNPLIYKSYTGAKSDNVLNNLKIICNNKLQDNCLIRIPLIPYYNTMDDIKESEAILRNMGFDNCEVFEYQKHPIKSTIYGIEYAWKQKEK